MSVKVCSKTLGINQNVPDDQVSSVTISSLPLGNVLNVLATSHDICSPRSVLVEAMSSANYNSRPEKSFVPTQVLEVLVGPYR